MKKILRKIHLWLSVPVGLIITVICLSGAMLVFETEIMESYYYSRYHVSEIKEKPLPMAQLIATVSKELPDTLSVASIQITADPKKNYRVGLTERTSGFIYVNPYTGEITEEYIVDNKGNFFSTIRRLHRWLLDDYKRDGSLSIGKTIVGVTTIIFVLILVTGIVIWMPKTRKKLKRSFKIRIKHGRKRFLRDLHTVGGIYAALVLLILALTGLTWSFTWYRHIFYGAFGVELLQKPQQKGVLSQTRLELPKDSVKSHLYPETRLGTKQSDQKISKLLPPKSCYAKWQDVIDELMAQNPDFETIEIQDGKVSLSSYKQIGNRRASDNYLFDPNTGIITETKFYQDQDKTQKLRGWIYSVHVGSWAGILSKVITFLAAILGASLPITGYYLWLRKYIRKEKKRKRRKNDTFIKSQI